MAISWSVTVSQQPEPWAPGAGMFPSQRFPAWTALA